MDISETVVLNHLKARGYAKITYEPDGNIPPDFLVDDQIAVEVRRLNQHHAASGNIALEAVAIPMWPRIEKLLGTFGPPQFGVCWCVFYRYRRPLPRWDELKQKITQALRGFIAFPNEALNIDLDIHENFTISLWRRGQSFDQVFVMGGSSDHDSGGFVVSEMLRNIELCIQEKSQKTRAVRHKYSQWWLALVDLIGYGLQDHDVAQLREHFNVQHDWDKIVLVSPNDPNRFFEL